MFGYCRELETIYVSESFNLSNLPESKISKIFFECYVLHGGAGTVWDSNMSSDGSLAKVDGGPSNKGLFTLKTV